MSIEVSDSLLSALGDCKEGVEAEVRGDFEKEVAQMAHDIRSPLSALNILVEKAEALPESQRILMRSAVSRINDIAHQLLSFKRKSLKKQNQPQFPMVRQALADTDHASADAFSVMEKESVLMASLLDSIVSEKRLEFKRRKDIQILGNYYTSYGDFAIVTAAELKRAISNIINNAVEALDEGGQIEVSLLVKESWLSIRITDNGRGMNEQLIKRVGEYGLSQGKEYGNGLGLYHAHNMLKNMGGHLNIESIIGLGTQVELVIPRAEAPYWFVESLWLRPHMQVVVLDDDFNIHHIWRGRCDSFKAHECGIEVISFTSGKIFKSWFENQENQKALYENTLFLVDFELIDREDSSLNQSGLDIIEELKIAPNSILVSSRYEEPYIKERSARLGVKMIPKMMAGFVPFRMNIEN